MVQDFFIPPHPDISDLVLEDDKPVDNFQSEKQQRLLVEPLYSSKLISKTFIAAANVGIFYQAEREGICPDVFLSLETEMPHDWTEKKNRSYMCWEFGKSPEVVIEIVSNRKGYELIDKTINSEVKTAKIKTYAQIGISYYAVFDPLQQIQEPEQMNSQLLKVFGLTVGRYKELEGSILYWLETVGLGLTLWEGTFEGVPSTWLRWCDKEGNVILTGNERANQAEEREERLAARLRELGIDPDELRGDNR